jgi:predicted nucleic acid-binding protein
MRRCVLDTSVVVKWFLDEEGSEAARFLQTQEIEISAPHFLLVEVANVLWKHVRKGKLEAVTGSRILVALGEVPIQWHEDSGLFLEAYRLANQTGRTVYDCLYLTLARAAGCPLITADRKFYDSIQQGPLAAHVTWIEEIHEG